jgi:hypothetical protein
MLLLISNYVGKEKEKYQLNEHMVSSEDGKSNDVNLGSQFSNHSIISVSNELKCFWCEGDVVDEFLVPCKKTTSLVALL